MGVCRSDAARWEPVVQARPKPDYLRLWRVWALRKDTYEAAIDFKTVPDVGSRSVFTLNGELAGRGYSARTTRRNWSARLR